MEDRRYMSWWHIRCLKEKRADSFCGSLSRLDVIHSLHRWIMKLKEAANSWKYAGLELMCLCIFG